MSSQTQTPLNLKEPSVFDKFDNWINGFFTKDTVNYNTNTLDKLANDIGTPIETAANNISKLTPSPEFIKLLSNAQDILFKFGTESYTYFLIFYIVFIISLVVGITYTITGKHVKYHLIIEILTVAFAGLTSMYLLYLNRIAIKSTTLEQIWALRNTNIVYLALFLAGIFLFYVTGFQTVMQNNSTNTMIVTGVISALYMLYIRTYNYNKMFPELIKTLGLISIIMLFVYNPFQIIPKLTAVNVFFILFAITFFLTIIVYYNHLYSDSATFKIENVTDGLKKMFFILSSAIISISVIILIFSSFGAFKSNQPSAGTYLLNVAIIIGMLAILYNILDTTGILKRHPLFRLIVTSTLYIPCLFTNVIELIMTEYYKTKSFTAVLIAIEAVLILINMAYPKIISWLYTSNGNLLINSPVDLSKEQVVSYYETLTGNNIIDLIANPSPLKLVEGNEVQLRQIGTTDISYGGTVINLNAKSNKYDILYDDGKYEYGVSRNNITPSSGLEIGSKVTTHRMWVAGTIKNVNYDGTYNVVYKINTEIVTDASGNTKFYELDNVFIENIVLLNEINPNQNSYRFSISCWIFLNSMAPNTNANYNKYTSLLNYSNNPNVMFNPATNDFIVSVVQNQVLENGAPDKNSNINDNPETYKIVYSNKNVLLQKWNNLVLNFDGGTLDIFYNGELVQSSNNIVPNIKYHELTVGTDSGIKAGLCNLVYFKEPLDIITINNLYNLTKTSGVPKVPEQSLFSYKI
jgi:hypothetical protein